MSANASSDAMAVSASVRGIERTNQIDTARIANAAAIGIAERGSMARRRVATVTRPLGVPVDVVPVEVVVVVSSEDPSGPTVTSVSYER